VELLLGSQRPIVLPRALLVHFEVYAKNIYVGIPGIVLLGYIGIHSSTLFVWDLPGKVSSPFTATNALFWWILYPKCHVLNKRQDDG
jgi:hypothetical protein